MIRIHQELSPTMRSYWDSENGLMTIEHTPTETKIIMTPQEQIELIKLVEKIVEADLSIGKKT